MALSYNRTYVENQSTGKALEGVVVRVYKNNVLQNVFADESSTPLPTVLTGPDGSATYYVNGDGTYEEEYVYNGDILDRVTVTILNPANYSATTDVTTILGAAPSTGHFGTFTGVTIPDNVAAKPALQALETATELRPTSATLAASGGSALVGFLQTGTGAVARTAQAKQRDVINAADWGIVGDGGTNNTVAMQALRDYAATRSFGGNTVKIIWPQGRYIYSASPNWAIEKLEIEFQGEVWLINTGTGVGFNMDGGAAGAGVRGLKITGFPRVYGETGSSHGYYIRAVHRSHFELICRGAGTAASGLYAEWMVSNKISYQMDSNDGGLYTVPARGMTLTQRAVNEQTSYCVFDNIELSGLPIGAYLDSVLGVKFAEGAIQANTKGVVITSNAKATKFSGVDFEVNSTADLEDEGESTLLFACDFEKGPVFKAASRFGRMIGGETFNINVDSGAVDTFISETIFNRSIVGGTGAITNAGTRTRFSSVINGKNNELYNRVRTTPTVTASPYTYTNTSGNNQAVIVSGGTLSQIALVRLAGDAIAETSGQYILGPGDAISLTYSSAPTFVVWPL